MERIINYDELPRSDGKHSIYLRMETDPNLMRVLLSKGYTIVNNIVNADDNTIYVTGRRQDYCVSNTSEYKDMVEARIVDLLGDRNFTMPKTYRFSFDDLVNHRYKLPFVFKNEALNCGKEKFLIETEEDYENLISTCDFLLNKSFLLMVAKTDDKRYRVDYEKYLSNFTIQEYVNTPSRFNTSVRLLTSSSNDLLYATLKYNVREKYTDETSLVGLFLSRVYPISSKSIVSNTAAGGDNILIGSDEYIPYEKNLLDMHAIDSDQFRSLIKTSKDIHEELAPELGSICGFDYIYDKDAQKWYLLEFHDIPMLGDYSRRQGIPYDTRMERLEVDGRVRATALNKCLQKTR